MLNEPEKKDIISLEMTRQLLLDALNENSFVRKLSLIRAHVSRFDGLDYEDIIQDVFIRIWDGTRILKAGVEFQAFYGGVLKSVLYEHSSKQKKWTDSVPEESYSFEMGSKIDAGRQLDTIEKELSEIDDDDVYYFFCLKIQEKTSCEIKQEMQWSEDKYEAIRKRFHRFLLRFRGKNEH